MHYRARVLHKHSLIALVSMLRRGTETPDAPQQLYTVIEQKEVRLVLARCYFWSSQFCRPRWALRYMDLVMLMSSQARMAPPTEPAAPLAAYAADSKTRRRGTRAPRPPRPRTRTTRPRRKRRRRRTRAKSSKTSSSSLPARGSVELLHIVWEDRSNTKACISLVDRLELAQMPGFTQAEAP